MVATVPLGPDRHSASGTVPIEVERSGWYLLRAWAERPVWPILDLYPFGSTSPIYVEVEGRPPQSSADAAYFLKWVERVRASAEARSDWNRPAEKEAVVRSLAAARDVYRRLASDPTP